MSNFQVRCRDTRPSGVHAVYVVKMMASYIPPYHQSSLEELFYPKVTVRNKRKAQYPDVNYSHGLSYIGVMNH